MGEKLKKEKKHKKVKKEKKVKKRKREKEAVASVASSVSVESVVASPKVVKKRKLLDSLTQNKESEDKALEVLLKDSKPLVDYEKDDLMHPKLISALRSRKINSLFEIQNKTFPIIVDGKDLIGRARTGMGKTLAFALPVLQQLLASPSSSSLPKVLVLAPTRELAKQVCAEFCLLPELRGMTVYGGTSINDQIAELRQGMDVVVGTPGRVIDLINRNTLKLRDIRHFILDEADQMLDMGFKEDMDTIFNAILEQAQNQGTKPQVLLFSATLPQWVQAVAAEKMQSPVTVDLVGDFESASKDVKHLRLQCPWDMSMRQKLVADLVKMYAGSELGRAMVFCGTKRVCDELASCAALSGDSRVIHGDVTQAVRETTLAGFRNNGFKLLIATDVASRGIDIKNVDLVINFEPPTLSNRGKIASYRPDVDSYVHRSGRTGRAGKKGVCVTLFTFKQKDLLDEIERRTKTKIERVGAPQVVDLVQGRVRAVAEDLIQVVEKPKVLSHFTEFSQELLEEFDHQSLVSALLALCSGYDKEEKLLPKSLLSSIDGYVTMKYVNSSKSDIGLGYVWGALKNVFGQGSQETEAVKGMTLLREGNGAVFDMRQQDVEVLMQKQRFGFEVCKELPELKLSTNQLNGTGRPFTPNRSGFGGGARERGGRGGRGRGRGRY